MKRRVVYETFIFSNSLLLPSCNFETTQRADVLNLAYYVITCHNCFTASQSTAIRECHTSSLYQKYALGNNNWKTFLSNCLLCQCPEWFLAKLEVIHLELAVIWQFSFTKQDFIARFVECCEKESHIESVVESLQLVKVFWFFAWSYTNRKSWNWVIKNLLNKFVLCAFWTKIGPQWGLWKAES